MQRCAFARHARNYFISSSRFSYLSNNPRFFSQIADPTLFTVVDDAPSEENGVVQIGHDVEEKVHDIDAELLENELESRLNAMHLTNLHQNFVKWAWNDKSFKVTTPVLESLVSAICSVDAPIIPRNKNEIYSLWDLVKEIGQKQSQILNVRILNELIISFSNLWKGKAALQVFNKFEDFQCVPNEDTYYFTIEALCGRSSFDQAWSVCQKMLDAEILPDGDKLGKIIFWFCKGKKVKEAHAVYLAAIEKRKRLPMSRVNILATTLCQENETVQLALETLNDIPEEWKELPLCWLSAAFEAFHRIEMFSVVIRALCRINKDFDAANRLMLKIVEEGLHPDREENFHIIIKGLIEIGKIGQAMEMIKLLKSGVMERDVFSMSNYLNDGDRETAGMFLDHWTQRKAWGLCPNVDEREEDKKIWEEAKKKHSKLSPLLMYHTRIHGYCKVGLFDNALRLLTIMKKLGTCPNNVDEYEKLIQKTKRYWLCGDRKV